MKGNGRRFGSLVVPLGLSVAAVIGAPPPPHAFSFEVTLKSSTAGIVQLFYDPSGGDGIRQADSARLNLAEVDTPVTHRFALPEGTYKGFRFDPIDREASVSLSGARVLRSGEWAVGDDVVRSVPVSQFQVATPQIKEFKITGDEARLVTVEGANDPILLITFAEPLVLKRERRTERIEAGKSIIALTASLWLLFALLGALYRRSESFVRTCWQRATHWSDRNPHKAIVVASVLGAIMSSYPVVFFGRSFVSPNHGTVLLYDKYPTLPGYSSAEMEDTRGADVGAPMWAHLPYSVAEGTAILGDFEWPLWNRFNSTGVPLLGQGQSMFGDPLHAGVILAGGASWAWDVKYVVAKALFVCGLGLTVLACTGHLATALILTLSSAYIGFFAFRLSHPAFFSLAYAPWILYFWIRFVQAPADHVSSQVRWLAGLILANFTVMNSGTAKEAYMLLISLNLTGAMMFLFQRQDVRARLTRGARLIFAQLLFVLISAPVWMTFLHTIQKSYSSYGVPNAIQISPSLILGLFDDVFYRELTTPEGVYAPAPSANVLILAGVLWALVGFRRLLKDPAFLAIGIGVALALSTVFGVIPPEVIAKVPFLGNVIHVHNTFSVVAIVQLIVLAGFGLKACWGGVGKRPWGVDLTVAMAIVGVLAVFYFDATKETAKSTFFVQYVASLAMSLVGLPLVARRLWKEPATPAILSLLAIFFVAIHWRHGMYLKTKFDDYVMNPQVRVDLHPQSPAIGFLKQDSPEPFRAAGFDGNLFAGYNGAIGVESIYGPDALINPYYRELLKLVPVEWGWDWKVVVQKKNLADLLPVYDLLNVRHYLSLPASPPLELPGLQLAGRFDLDVYRSDTAWPRAFFTNQLKTYESPAEFAAMAMGHDGQPFAAIQGTVLKQHPSLQALRNVSDRKVVPATGYSLTSNTTTFTVAVPEAGVIVLTEAYAEEDLFVRVNGKPAIPLRVNHAFRGVQVDGAGTYVVTFSYWPRHFTASLLLCAAGLLMLSAWLFHHRVGRPTGLMDRNQQAPTSSGEAVFALVQEPGARPPLPG